MVKKFFAFYIVFCIFFSNVAFAEKKETHREYYNDIQEDDLKSIEEVLNKYQIIKDKKDYKREIKKDEFIESVLKVIGLNDDMVEFYYRTVSHSGPAFSDVGGGYDSDEKFHTSSYVEMSGYFGIAKGKRISKATLKLYPDKEITIDECLEIMNRCLNRNVSDDVIYQAKENGLIKDTDKVLSRVHRTLTYEDLCVLLYRFSVKQIGYYFDLDSPWDIRKFHFPSDKKMNYLELLESRNSDRMFKALKRELIKMRERERELLKAFGKRKF